MNKENRADLQKAISLMEDAKEIIERIKDGEQEKYDNLSEGLQQSEKGQKFEEAASTLGEVYDQLEGSIDSINDIVSE